MVDKDPFPSWESYNCPILNATVVHANKFIFELDNICLKINQTANILTFYIIKFISWYFILFYNINI
jgi:hypothetical protein